LRLVDFEDSPILPYLLEVRSPLTFSYIAFRSWPTLSLIAFFFAHRLFFRSGLNTRSGLFARDSLRAAYSLRAVSRDASSALALYR